MIIGLTIITYAALAAALILGVYIGIKRGLARSVVRSVYLVVLLPLSYLVGHLLAGMIAEWLVEELRGSGGILGQLILGISGSMELIEVLAKALITAVSFALMFGALEALSLIYFKHASDAIVKKVVGEDTQPGRHTALFGGFVGLAQGMVVSTVLLLPLCMCVTLMATSSPTALASLGIPGFDGASEEDAALEHSPVELLPSNQLLYPMTRISDDDIPDGYAELRGTDLCAMAEAPDIINSAGNAKEAYLTATSHHDTELVAMIRALGAMNAAHGDSQMLEIFMKDVVHATADIISTVEELRSLFAASDSDSDGIAHLLMIDLMNAMKQATPDNVGGMVEVLAGNGFHTSTVEDMLTIKDNTASGDSIKDQSELVADVLLRIGENDDLRHAINGSTDTVISDYLAGSKTSIVPDDMPDDQTKELFETISDELNEHIDHTDLSSTILDSTTSYSEKVESVSNTISSRVADYDYALSDSDTTLAAICLISYCESGKEIDPENIMKYLGISDEDIARILAMQ